MLCIYGICNNMKDINKRYRKIEKKKVILNIIPDVLEIPY